MNLVKFVTRTFPKFIGKYADEISIVGTVLSRLLWGKSLSNGERDALQQGLDGLLQAADNIRASLEQFSTVDVDEVLADVKRNAEELLQEIRKELGDVLDLKKRVAELEAAQKQPAGDKSK